MLYMSYSIVVGASQLQKHRMTHLQTVQNITNCGSSFAVTNSGNNWVEQAKLKFTATNFTILTNKFRPSDAVIVGTTCPNWVIFVLFENKFSGLYFAVVYK